MTNTKRTYHVLILETIPAFLSFRTHEQQVLSFAEFTFEEAKVEAARQVEALVKRTGHAHRATFRRSCAVCDVSGIKPGCKRKKCEACGGRGSVEMEAA